MKKRLLKVLPLASLLAVGYALPVQAAGGIWDIVTINASPDAQGTTTAGGKLNGSKVTVSWGDTNGDKRINDNELITSMKITDRNGNVLDALAYYNNPFTISRQQLGAWADVEAVAILQALFPAGLSEITGASEDNMMTSATVSHNLFSKTVAKKQGGGAQLSSDLSGQLEYQDLKVNDNKGSAVGMTMNYAKEGDSGLNFSLTAPYRYSSMKDDVDSKSHFLGLDLAVKYPAMKWDKGDWKVGGALFGSAYYLKTNTIEKSGDLKYGGGLFTSANQNLGFGTLGVGVDYRISKAYLPSSMNTDNVFLDSAVDYVNNLKPVHTVSYGFNLGVPLAGDAAAVNLEVIRSNFISSDIPDGQKNKTTVSLSGTYFPTDTFELNLGAHYDFELDNVKSLGVMLGVVSRF